MLIIKVAGSAALNVAGLAADLAKLKEPWVLVHGFEDQRDQLAWRLGVTPRTVCGDDGTVSLIHDQTLMDLQLMAGVGLAGKQLVTALQRHGVSAVGLTGLDGGLIQGRRCRSRQVPVNGRKRTIRDHFGRPEHVRVELIHALVNQSCFPVVTPPIVDESGSPIMADPDELVMVLQRDLEADVVALLHEAAGILDDPADPASRIPRLQTDMLQERERRAPGPVRSRLRAIRVMVERGARVFVGDGRRDQPLFRALAGEGTVVA